MEKLLRLLQHNPSHAGFFMYYTPSQLLGLLYSHYYPGYLQDSTVVLTKSDSDLIFCLQLLSQILNCTLHLSLRESIDHLCIYPILQIGLIHK